MNPRTCRVILLVMGSVGWILASVLGTLACLLAADARGHDVPWQILGAMVFGPMLASIPVGITLLAAHGAFGENTSSEKRLLAAKQNLHEQLSGKINWRWVALAGLCGLEMLVLPLSVVAAGVGDFSLILSIPLNTSLVLAILLTACIPYQRRASIALCGIHLIGIAIAAIAAAIEIESVMVSGACLLFTGVALALVGPRPGAARIFFAASTVAFIATSFLVIALGRVGQRQAEAPLVAAMVAYEILFAPIGLMVLYHMFSRRESPAPRRFGIHHVFGPLAVAGVALAVAGVAYFADDDARVFITVCLGALAVCGVALAVGAGGWAGSSGEMQPAAKTKLA